MTHWRNTEQGWGLTSILIHWLTAVAVIGLFILGLWMVELTYYDDWYTTAPHIHRSVGVLLLLLTLTRMVWNRFNTKPDHLVSHTAWEQKAARLTHHALYILLLAIMLSGYLISTADGRSIDVFGLFSIPATVHGIEGQEDMAGNIHLVLSISMISLVVLHALAALKHHFFDKDATLKRMLGL